eukprot:65749-Chlamydomonas_euryale.AAC.2
MSGGLPQIQASYGPTLPLFGSTLPRHGIHQLARKGRTTFRAKRCAVILPRLVIAPLPPSSHLACHALCDNPSKACAGALPSLSTPRVPCAVR